MRKFKLTKKSGKAIKQLAAIFPEKRMNESHRVNMKGQDLIGKGTVKASDNKEIDPDQVYSSYVTGSKAVNHEKRMRAAYESNGRDGAKGYGKNLLKPEHYGEWCKVVDDVFNYEEKGILAQPTFIPGSTEEPVAVIDDTVNFEDSALFDTGYTIAEDGTPIATLVN